MCNSCFEHGFDGRRSSGRGRFQRRGSGPFRRFRGRNGCCERCNSAKYRTHDRYCKHSCGFRLFGQDIDKFYRFL